MFNENEIKVIELLREEVKNCTGDEFGYMSDCSRGEFTKHQFAGYISSLKSKNVFEYLSNDFDGQFALNNDFLELL